MTKTRRLPGGRNPAPPLQPSVGGTPSRAVDPDLLNPDPNPDPAFQLNPDLGF